MKYRDLTKKIKMEGENLKIWILLLKVLLILHFFLKLKKEIRKKPWEGSQESELGGALNIRFTETIINK